MFSKEEIEARWQDYIDYTCGKFGFGVINMNEEDYIECAIEYFGNKADEEVVRLVAIQKWRL